MSRHATLLTGWLLALATITVFTSLGFWQLRRAVEKQAMLDAAAQVVTERRAVPLAAAARTDGIDRYDWSSGTGEFADSPALLLDNQQRDGRVGVRAYRIFAPDRGQPLLVELGWLPLSGERTMPSVPRPGGRIVLQGLLAPPPSSGIALGPGMARSGEAWLLMRVDIPAIRTETGVPLSPRVLRLDPASPLGYARDLELLSNTLPPDKHRGYALQWFGLALAVFVTALILTFKQPRRAAKAAA
ncbi:MAG TPA: SURF1 family protein [Lysobacter sp.]|jgi:cytochrome oxidase assembly protein ShyY1|nr:SURF1 family protein [Lysobacter sp.]